MNTPDDVDPYASWTESSTGFTVNYSLPVFHEIDFVVNEGFRRIPHGGIESAGLLLGECGPDSIRIDGFLPIECSHAFGPAFLLSGEDIATLRSQINNQTSAQQTVGWFISHSRSQLVMTEQESSLANSLFGTWSITVLVKPEKFKATQFAFFIGTDDRDGTGKSFALPLVSRRNRSVTPTLKPIGDTKIIPEARPARAFDDTPVKQKEAKPPPQVEESAPVAPAAPSIVEERPRPNATLWLMAGAAAAFACLAAYGFYRSAVPADVPLSVAAHGNSLVVSWPAEMSRAAAEARIRVNNSEMRDLAPDEKASGVVSIDNGSDSVEIELILSRWGREAHSIERYLRTAKTSVRSVSPPQASAPVVPGP